MAPLVRSQRAVVLLVVAGLGGCGPRPAAEQTGAPVLRLALVGTAVSLDPVRSGWVVESRVIEQMADTLVELDANLQLRPGLAESWEVLEGGRLFRFRLGPWATWGDGQPLHAAQVVAALARLAAPGDDVTGWAVIQDVEGAEARHLGNAPGVPGLQAPDPRTVVIRLAKPSSRFLYQLCSAYGRVFVGDGSTEDWRRGRLAGTGPFRLEGRDDTEVAGGRCQRFRFVARQTGPRAPRVPRLVIDLFRSGADMLKGLGQEPYDVVYSPPFDRPLVEERLPQHRLTLAPRLAFLSLYFDCEKPPVNRPEVRRAIVLAANREVLPRKALAPGQFLSGLTAEDAILPPDPARGRALARAAGFDPSRPTPLRVAYSASFEYGDVSAWVKERLKDSLAPLGLAVEAVEAPDGGALDARSSARLDHAYIYGSTPEYADPCVFFDTFRSGNPGSNLSWYSRKEVDQAYEECAHSLDLAVQRASIDHVKPLIADDAPILPLAPIYQRAYQAPRIRGFQPSPLEGMSLREVTLGSQ